MLHTAILVENYPPDSGGIAASAARLVQALSGSVHVHLVKFPRGESDIPETWSTEEPRRDLTVHTVTPFVNGWKHMHVDRRRQVLYRTASRIATRLGDQVDVVHGFGLQNAGLAAACAAILRRTPLIQSVRGNDVGRNSFDATRRPSLMVALHAADVITSVNRWLAGLICWQWPTLAGRVRIVPNGVQLRSAPNWTSTAETRMELGFPLGVPVVGTVGVMREKKGPHILAAIACGCIAPLGGRLLIIGGVDFDFFRSVGWSASFAEQVVRCVHARDADELVRYIEVCDWCVFPSLDDGMANGLLEALERSRAVVASPVFSDVIEHGRSGLIVSPFLPAEYVATGKRLNECTALRRALGAAARERIEAAFTMDREREAWLDLYRQVGSKKRK